MLALLGYPTLVEPNLSLSTQAVLWIAGYGLLLALIACCAASLWRAKGRVGVAPHLPASSHPVTRSPGHPVTLARRLRWPALAFVPSSLMLGLTTYITTDLAAIPLLWVIPLAIYLLSFILVFSRAPALVHRLFVLLLPVLILLVVFRIPEGVRGYLSVGDVVLFDFIILRRLADLIVLHLVGLFVASMVCHGELARTRPGPQHLTEFYLWMSLGGVLGGLFNGLVAPLLFDRIVEYPLIIVGACLLLPRMTQQCDAGWFRGLDVVLSVAFGLFGFVIGGFLLARTYVTVQTVTRLPGPLQEPADWFVENYGKDESGVLLRERSFFGMTLITEHVRADGSLMRWMYHGTTVHGGQQFSTEESRMSRRATLIAAGNPLEAAILLEAQQVNPQHEPLTYFHRQGPIGRLFRAVKEKQPRQRVAVLGMGVGTLAAYAEPGWQITFFEIDPAVVRIAENPAYFTYLHDCRERIGNDNVNIVLGDGRLKLQESQDTYDLLFMDAFSSDSVPVHLITREAIDMYFEKLAPGGILVVNIANRYLNLEPVLANLAQASGRQAMAGYDAPDSAIGKYASMWVLIAREGKDFGALGQDLRRWPWDPDRHWHNLLAPPSAEALTARDLADWKRDFIARKRFEFQLDEEAVETFQREFEATPASETAPARGRVDRPLFQPTQRALLMLVGIIHLPPQARHRSPAGWARCFAARRRSSDIRPTPCCWPCRSCASNRCW